MTSPASSQPPAELLELQLDYWSLPRPDNQDKLERLQKKDSKSSLKTTFRSVQVYRLPQSGGQSLELGSTLSMTVVTKEKKQYNNGLLRKMMSFLMANVMKIF